MNDSNAAVVDNETSHSDTSATSTPPHAAPTSNTPKERPWYAAIRDPGVRNWVAAKGFPDPIAAAESGYHSEKLLGHHRAGRTVVLPREDSPPDEVRAYRAKLGVPDKPEGYALPVPPGKSDEFAKAASRWMHEAGVPAKAAQQLAGRWNQHIAQLERQSRDAWAAESAAGVAAMQTEWGTSYEHNAEVARRAALHFLPGADGESRTKMMDKIERALGSADFLRFMAAVGKGLTEHKLVQSGEAGDGSNLSPEQARHRIATLRADRAWTAAYVNGDGAKQAEMSRLHRMAFPGS